MSGSITASRYSNALRYNPFRLQTGRYPVQPTTDATIPTMPVPQTPQQVAPSLPPAPPVVDSAAPAPASAPPVYIGSAPVEWRPDNGEGGGVGSGGAGDPFGSNYGGIGDNSLGGMPGPSPDQSIGGLLGALATGAGFALGPIGAMTGVLAGVVNDVERGQTVGTSRSLTDVVAQVLGLTPPSQAIAGMFGDSPGPGEMSANQGLGLGLSGPSTPSGLADVIAAAGGEGAGGYGGQTDAVGAAQAAAQGDYGALADAALGMGYGGYGDNYGETGSMAGYGGYGGYGGEGAGGAGAGGSTDAMGAAQAGAQGDYGGMAEAAAGMGAWKSGGFTGHGRDGRLQRDRPAGTVHEGEVVLNADATRHYGPNALLALNARRVPANELRKLIGRYA